MKQTEQKQYGVVQDDGTVTEYPTQRAAERAGRLEALVVRSGDGWVYPTTGRTFDPSDVEGLSPATASQQVDEVLRRNSLRRMVHGGIVSHVIFREPSRMCTKMNLLKPSTEEERAPGSVFDRKVEAVRAALRALPGVIDVHREGDEPMYNYVFITVVRRRAA